MDINNLTLGQVKEIAGIAACLSDTPKFATANSGGYIGDLRPVIVRSLDAGVLYGKLKGYEGSTVHLTDARQMWSWTAAEGGTLLDCATHGVKAGKFSTVAQAVTVIGACSIIDVTEKAVKSLDDAKWSA